MISKLRLVFALQLSSAFFIQERLRRGSDIDRFIVRGNSDTSRVRAVSTRNSTSAVKMETFYE
jgi:hypothetical protein